MPEPQVGIENEVAGIGGHEKATLNDFRIRLHNINLLCRKAARCVGPDVVNVTEIGKSSSNLRKYRSVVAIGYDMSC